MALICFIAGLGLGTGAMIERSVKVCLDTCECPEENVKYGHGNDAYKINFSQWGYEDGTKEE